MRDLRAQFRGTPSSVRLAREAVVNYARACGFTADSLEEIALASGEALANAVEHGNKDLGFIEVACSFVDDALCIEIGDAGLGFDVTQVRSRERDPDAIRGFGITIMHAIMDGVTYYRRGALVRLIKRRVAVANTLGSQREEA